MIKVLLADDHTMFREGLKQVFADTTDIEVTGEAKNSKEVLKKILENSYDVIVLDISMPGRDGIDVIKEIKNITSNTSILILSMYPEDQYAVRAIKAGAAGYITKNKASRKLISAIRKISTGRKYISQIVAEQLAIDLGRDNQKLPHEKLSNREYQVMSMIALGKTVNAIAKELTLSISTISTNRARILQKMNLKNNAELTYYAIKHKLVK
jgi:DNA-binding NarL/FixJ family response regulator